MDLILNLNAFEKELNMGVKEFFWPTKTHIAIFVILMLVTFFAVWGAMCAITPDGLKCNLPLEFVNSLVSIVAPPLLLLQGPVLRGMESIIKGMLVLVLVVLYWYILSSIINYIIKRFVWVKNKKIEKPFSNI